MTASWYSTLEDEVGGNTLRGLHGNTTKPLVLNSLPAHGNVTLGFDLVTVPLSSGAYSGNLKIELREVGPGPTYTVTRTTLKQVSISNDGQDISRVSIPVDAFNHSGKTHLDFEFTATGLPTSTGTWGIDNVIVMADGLTTPTGRPEVSIAAEEPVAEGEDASFTVTRTGGDQSQPLTVNLSLPSGTATAGDDYDGQTVPTSVTIPASQSSYSFSVATIQDTAYEPDETLAIALAPKGNDYTMASTTPAAVTIQDDDIDFPSLQAYDQAPDGAAAAVDSETQDILPVRFDIDGQGHVAVTGSIQRGSAAGPVRYAVEGPSPVEDGTFAGSTANIVLPSEGHYVITMWGDSNNNQQIDAGEPMQFLQVRSAAIPLAVTVAQNPMKVRVADVVAAGGTKTIGAAIQVDGRAGQIRIRAVVLGPGATPGGVTVAEGPPALGFNNVLVTATTVAPNAIVAGTFYTVRIEDANDATDFVILRIDII